MSIDEHENEIYQEGYQAVLDEQSDDRNPYSGMDAEFWSDGHEDAIEDLRQAG